MSQFTTTLPIDVDAVLAHLPKGAFVHPTYAVQISADKRSVVIHWEHDDIKTPYTRPVEYPLEALKGKEAKPDSILPFTAKDVAAVLTKLNEATIPEGAQPINLSDPVKCKRVQNAKVAPAVVNKAKL